jgi:hypothetical protein
MTISAQTLIQISYFDALLTADIDEQRNIQLARNYHKGDQTVHLTERAQEFLALNSSVDFRLNICQSIVTAVQDELNVVGFDTTEKAEGEGSKKQSQWASTLWQLNRMDSKQNDVHEATLRDREAFVIVDWDIENSRPRMTFHERFVSTEAGGDGTGCWMVYENDDINQPAVAAVKQWSEMTEENGRLLTRMRRTVYYPDRIERWVYGSDDWEHYGEGGKGLIPWVSGKGKNARPLGIPVIHFRNEGLAPEAWEAIPLQDAINKIMVDILASADTTGFRIFVALGWIPTTDGKELRTDGSNELKIAPGQVIGTSKSKNDAAFDAIDGADVAPLMNTLIEIIAIAAQITATPVSRFVMTRQLAGAETVKQQDKPLQRKAKKRRVLFGNGWEDVMSMARKLDNLYGRAGLDESILFSALWEHSTSLDELKDKRESLSIPLEQLWMEAGYSPEKITSMKNSEEYQLTREKLLWEAASAAQAAGVSLETVLRRAGIDTAEFGRIGTEKLADIKTKQEDVIPPNNPETGEPITQ